MNPLPNRFGTDTITFRVSDLESESGIPTVSIAIAAVNTVESPTNGTLSGKQRQSVDEVR